MQELQTTENKNTAVAVPGQLSPRLNQQQALIIKNSEAPRCKVLLQSDEGLRLITDNISGALQRAKLIAGFRANAEATDDDRRTIILEMIKVIKQHYWLSIADLKQIIDMGLVGNFDSEDNRSFALNARTLNTWIKSYQEQYRSAAMKIQAEHLQQLEDEKEEQAKIRAYEEAKVRNANLLLKLTESLTVDGRTGKITEYDITSEHDMLCLALYPILDSKNLLKITVEEKKAMYQEVMNSIQVSSGLQEFTAKKICRIRTVRQHIARLANSKVNIEAYINENLL